MPLTKLSIATMFSDTMVERAITTSVALLSYYPHDTIKDGKPPEPDPH
jgi:hypothetical protein